MNKCEFCNSRIPYNVNNCPSCGAPCEYIPDPHPRKKQQTLSEKNNISATKSSSYVESMADIDIDVNINHKSKCKGDFFDNLEADLEQTQARNIQTTKRTLLGCAVLIIVIIFIITIIASIVS